MKLIFSLLSLGTTAGGVIAGTLQQNLSQAEKPYIDILFKEIVEEMRKFSEKNPISRKDLKEIRCIESQGDAKENCEKTIENSIEKVNSESDNNKLPQYTFQFLTNIWTGLLSTYIESWHDKENKWGDSTKPYLKVKGEFTEKNKIEKFQESKKLVKREEDKFKEKLKIKEIEIQKIYEKIKEFILLLKLPEKYNLSNSYESPYEHHIKALKWN